MKPLPTSLSYLAITLIVLAILFPVRVPAVTVTPPAAPVLTTAVPTDPATPTASPTNTPVLKATSTPTATPQPLPTDTLTPLERLDTPFNRWLLARLCVSEANGMTGVRQDACLSVIDTAIQRTLQGYLSNGDLFDTLSWGWRPNQAFQFDPWLALDCGYEPLPDFVPDDLLYCPPSGVSIECEKLADKHCRKDQYDRGWADTAVGLYFAGERGSCSGYLYYNSIVGGSSECELWADNGQWIEFYNKE
jgi:hypothetical protein